MPKEFVFYQSVAYHLTNMVKVCYYQKQQKVLPYFEFRVNKRRGYQSTPHIVVFFYNKVLMIYFTKGNRTPWGYS